MKSIRIFFALGILFLQSVVIAQAPELVNYQGRLMDSSGIPVADATYSMKFRIYDAETGDNLLPCGASGANCLWEETQTVATRKGIFNVLLGSVNPLNAPVFSSSNRWLGVTVGTDSEMIPRQRIASSPYALQGAGGGGFPAPAYDSGWVHLNQLESRTFVHNVGGDRNKYFVDLQARDYPGFGNRINIQGHGDATSQQNMFYYTGLTESQVTVTKGSNDLMIYEIRLRIWVTP